MSLLTLYNGRLLVTESGALQLSESAANPCCCDFTCPQPYVDGLLDPIANGWQPKNDDNQIVFRTTLPITHSFRIEQAENCGGSNTNRQSGALTCSFTLREPSSVRFSVEGYVERQDSGFDYGTLYLGGQSVQISSFDENLGCAQAFNSAEATINLPAGTHQYTMEVDTIDAAYHENTEYTFKIDYA